MRVRLPAREEEMAAQAHSTTASESVIEDYQFLEPRRHAWRRQLSIKGRNLTVGQLVWNMRTNRHTPESAAENYDLSVDQVREALRYYDHNRDVIEQDEQEEQRRLIDAGIIRDSPSAEGQ